MFSGTYAQGTNTYNALEILTFLFEINNQA